MTKRFVGDILEGVFAEPNHTYARCFDVARSTFKKDFEQLDISLLGLICELALDPPLPFDENGCAIDWNWSSFHPMQRFLRLLNGASRFEALKHMQVDEVDVDDLQTLNKNLLAEARLARAKIPDLLRWLETYDEDTTEWPSQELAWQHGLFSKAGRAAIEQSPSVLFNFDRAAIDNTHGPFFNLPYVIIDGQTHSLNVDGEPEYREAGQQVLNGHLARATDHFAFGCGALDILGLSTDSEDSFTIFSERLHEFFSSAWNADILKIKTRMPGSEG